jgi:hypothetical protein
MGAGGLAQADESKKKEFEEKDVAYKVLSFFDHAYVLCDGQNYALDKKTADIPGGIGLQTEFLIPKQGDKRQVKFAYLIPESAANIAFQFLDYIYGHILILVKGDLKMASLSVATRGKALDQMKDQLVEIAANQLNFQDEYNGTAAPEGWRYATVELSGKSIAGEEIGAIFQISPKDYIWVTTKEGYLYYCSGGSTTDDGYIRFTPEAYQSQEVAFLVPKSANPALLGIRIEDRVYLLKLAGQVSVEIPKPLATHRDGNTMEVMLFGTRQDQGAFILDLGLRSLANSGIEIQTADQFIILVSKQEIYFDPDATRELFHRPPEIFVIPPQAFVRFELAYKTDAVPSSLYFRGYESEKYFDLAKDNK